jgi:hypothetical protein
MQNKITIINAFDAEDYFIEKLSKEYDNAVTENGMVSELLFISSMNFSFAPFPQQYTFDTLERDLQESVNAIKSASTLAFFTSYHTRKHINPAFAQFVSRLFHLQNGSVNKSIWGEGVTYNKRIRIISVIDDVATWKKYKFKKDASILPINKIDFSLFGFDEVFTSTFGYLQDNEMNEYGLKCLSRMHDFALSDCLNK